MGTGTWEGGASGLGKRHESYQNIKIYMYGSDATLTFLDTISFLVHKNQNSPGRKAVRIRLCASHLLLLKAKQADRAPTIKQQPDAKHFKAVRTHYRSVLHFLDRQTHHLVAQPFQERRVRPQARLHAPLDHLPDLRKRLLEGTSARRLSEEERVVVLPRLDSGRYHI